MVAEDTFEHFSLLNRQNMEITVYLLGPTKLGSKSSSLASSLNDNLSAYTNKKIIALS